MALPPTAVKYIAIAVIIVVGIFVIGALVWDILKIAVGLLIGGGLIYLGMRFLMGKGLPPKVKKLADKALSSEEDEKPDEKE